jgi:hypothetical protein
VCVGGWRMRRGGAGGALLFNTMYSPTNILFFQFLSSSPEAPADEW